MIFSKKHKNLDEQAWDAFIEKKKIILYRRAFWLLIACSLVTFAALPQPVLLFDFQLLPIDSKAELFHFILFVITLLPVNGLLALPLSRAFIPSYNKDVWEELPDWIKEKYYRKLSIWYDTHQWLCSS